MGTNTPLGLKIQNDYRIHHHHHLGQNRPHQKDNYLPTWPPPQPAEPYCHFLGGSEGIIGPPLPRLLPEKVPTVEQLLYCYIVGLGLDCKFIDLLIKRSINIFIKISLYLNFIDLLIKCSINIFIKISLYLNFIVLEIISKQTDTLI